MKTILAMLLVFAVCTSVVHADLRYTTRVDVRKTASATAGPVPEQVVTALQVLMPPGETRIFVRADSMRIEQSAGTTSTVALIRPDGQFVLYPDSQTYARIPLPGGVPTAPGQTLPLAVRRTGEFATYFGLRAERVLVTMTLVLPVTPPAGFPTTITLEGELWLADAYRDGSRRVEDADGSCSERPGRLRRNGSQASAPELAAGIRGGNASNGAGRGSD